MFFAAGASTLAGSITLLSSAPAAFRSDAASAAPFSGRPALTSPVTSPVASVASSSGGARR